MSREEVDFYWATQALIDAIEEAFLEKGTANVYVDDTLVFSLEGADKTESAPSGEVVEFPTTQLDLEAWIEKDKLDG